MKLLVSVARANEVGIACGGGADIIDAKDPSHGGLGAVPKIELAAIAHALDGARPLSVALGEATDERAVARAVEAASSVGAAYVKLGFLGIRSPTRVQALAAAAVAAAAGSGTGTRVIVVAYADAARVSSIGPDRAPELAARVGAAGTLLDTARKDGGSLWTLMPPDLIAAWVERAHAAGLLAALAGSLDAAGVALAAEIGADIAGVRGAACVGGREGRVSAELVAALAALSRAAAAVAVSSSSSDATDGGAPDPADGAATDAADGATGQASSDSSSSMRGAASTTATT